MPLLRSYSFNKELNDDILNLFSELVEDGSNGRCECCYEIIVNALDGKIDLNSNFNIRGYESVVRQNNSIANVKRGSKESSLQSEVFDYTNKSVLLEDILVIDDNSPYDDFENNDEFEWALSYINTNYSFFIVNECTDIGYCIIAAYKGFPQSVKQLTKLCDKYPALKQSIKVVLEHGIDDEVKNLLGGSRYG